MIAPNVVLTAAHCDPDGIYFVGAQALVGAYERQQETYGAEFVTISAQEVHPQYDDWELTNDFQLLRLANSVTTANPVCPTDTYSIGSNNNREWISSRSHETHVRTNVDHS